MMSAIDVGLFPVDKRSSQRNSPMTVHISFHKTFPMRAAEWALALMALSWGIVLLTHPHISQGDSTMGGMIAMRPQTAWGMGSFAIGIISLVALAINGFWIATPFIRAVCAFFRAGFWLTIIIALVINDTASADLAIYPWIFILELWNIYRSMSDARQVV